MWVKMFFRFGQKSEYMVLVLQSGDFFKKEFTVCMCACKLKRRNSSVPGIYLCEREMGEEKGKESKSKFLDKCIFLHKESYQIFGVLCM